MITRQRQGPGAWAPIPGFSPVQSGQHPRPRQPECGGPVSQGEGHGLWDILWEVGFRSGRHSEHPTEVRKGLALRRAL